MWMQFLIRLEAILCNEKHKMSSQRGTQECQSQKRALVITLLFAPPCSIINFCRISGEHVASIFSVPEFRSGSTIVWPTRNLKTWTHTTKDKLFFFYDSSPPFLGRGLPDLLLPAFYLSTCRLLVRKRSTNDRTAKFCAAHSVTATCITLLQMQVSAWRYWHYLQPILLRWDHLCLFFYDLHASRGHIWLFNFFWKAKRTFLWASLLFNMKAPGHFAPIILYLVICGYHKGQHAKLTERPIFFIHIWRWSFPLSVCQKQ